jgi:hypothetical protein
MSTTLNLSVSYEVVTEESAEHGDFAYAGWVVEGDNVAFRDALSEIGSRGYPVGMSVRHDALTIFHEAEADYRTGEHTSEATHIQGDPRAIARLARMVSRKYRV